MTGTSRKLGLLLALSAFAPVALPAASGPAPSVTQDVKTLFEQGVDFLSRGRDDEALKAFQQALAANPTHEQAFELFRTTDQAVWMEMLTKNQDFELVAKRFMELASLGRKERRDDAEAIRGLVAKLKGNDPMGRIAATRQLSSDHGEYAVPYLVPALGDAGDEDRRIATMQTLAEMNLDVVLPLMAALETSDAYLRRNIALTLGRIGDKRAVPALAALSAGDQDSGVRQAADEALTRLGSQGTDAGRTYVQLGNAYANRDGHVLAASPDSTALWAWDGTRLSHVEVPAEVWADVMARRCYGKALELDSNSAEALAGFVRAQVAAETKLGRMEGQEGAELDALKAQLDQSSVAVGLAGAAAADSALQAAIMAHDIAASLGLVQAVSKMAARPTPGLQAALASDDGSLRSAAAIGLGSIAVDTQTSPGAEVVGELARAAAREVVRIAFVIDPDTTRSSAVAANLRSQGMMVTTSENGALGLGLLHRLPGVDVVLIADRLPDITTFQVISDLTDDPRFASTPRVLITNDGEAAGELFGDSVSGMVVGGDASGVGALLEQSLNRDRAEADAFSRLAAATLADLAASGADISEALDALAGCMATRPDAVAVPASRALARAGTAMQVPALVAACADASRSDDVRAACADAVAMIVTRGAGSLSPENAAQLREVVASESALDVRRAAARAVGASDQSNDERGSAVLSVNGAKVDAGAGEN
jgi:HEAT repeat protein